jgi:hypothetical protein
LDAYGVEADISQPTISAEIVENDPTATLAAAMAFMAIYVPGLAATMP